MHDLIIVGAGGHGRETLDIVEAINARTPTWVVQGFVDDDKDLSTELIDRREAKLLGTSSWLRDSFAQFVIAIGSSHVRAIVDERIDLAAQTAPALVHPSATIAADNLLGPGVLIAAGAHVTTNVILGRHVHLNVACVVSHDCVVGAYTSLAPGAMLNGNVRVGERVLIGSGAVVLPGVTIGDDAVIGAGAVVTKDVPAGVTAKGVPAHW